MPTLDETICRELSELEAIIRRSPARLLVLHPDTSIALLLARLPVFRPVFVFRSVRLIPSGLVQKVSLSGLSPRC